MGLRDEVANTARGTKDTARCKAVRVADELPEAERGEYVELLLDPTVGAKPLEVALRKRGVVVSDDAIREHRKGTCVCVSA